MPSNATWFRQHVPKCLQMRHGFDNMFQNALKCDMVSTTCAKMLSNATWFRQHVPNLPTYQPTNLPTYQPTNLPTYQPTNLPTYQPTFIFIFISCACTTLLCMHTCACTGGARAQGRDPTKKQQRVRPFWVPALAKCCACTRILCMHKNQTNCNKFSNLCLGTSWYVFCKHNSCVDTIYPFILS